MFVEAADFSVPPYDIPNLDAVINSFITFEIAETKDQLRKILGRTLADAFIAAVEAQPDPLMLDQRWKDLYLGKEYTHTDGKKYVWEGMEKSFLPYIYAIWMTKTGVNANSGTGIVEPENENSHVASPARPIVNAFNKFSDYIGSSRCQLRNTLIGFLYNSGDVYLADVPDYESVRGYMWDRIVYPGRMNVFNL